MTLVKKKKKEALLAEKKPVSRIVIGLFCVEGIVTPHGEIKEGFNL